MDSLYTVDDELLDTVRASKAWLKEPKYFRKVKINPSAAIKMAMHAQSGVEKGIKQSGKPVEVMGLLVGRPDVCDPGTLIVSDAQPLPIEGFETRVIADDENVLNYMIELGESNDLSRKERFMGWYHSHPFDVDVNSHCYLSSTDISTQLQWQRSEDPHGNPFLAIVIDPLRSLAKGRPEMMAFRVYPPDYNPPLNQTPDGSLVSDDRLRVEKWGTCWNRYYKLDISYYTSSLAATTLNIVKNNFLWQNSFTSTPMLEPDHKQRIAERISNISDKVDPQAGVGKRSTDSSQGQGQSSSSFGSPRRSNTDVIDESFVTDMNAVSTSEERSSTGNLTKTNQGSIHLASEQGQGMVTLLAKATLFGSSFEN